MLKILFTTLLGILLALFIGLGLEAFYPGEKYPQQPDSLAKELYAKPIAEENNQISAEQIEAQKKFDQEVKDYQNRREKHARNTSIVATIFSIVLMILSLTILQKTHGVFSDGFLLGSILTLFYAIIRGFEGQDTKFRFILVSVGLLFALILGYLKFVKEKPVITK